VPEWLPAALIWTQVALMLAYVGLFLFRQDTRLRTTTLAIILLVGTTGQALSLAGAWAEHTSNDVVALICQLIVVGTFFGMRRVYLVRARPQSVRATIDEASRRLMLSKEEPQPGVLLLGVKGILVPVRLIRVGGCTLILFPRPPGPGKLTLFFDWLSKRYPGPIPRVRVSLNRR
jgi:hypothetical protein